MYQNEIVMVFRHVAHQMENVLNQMLLKTRNLKPIREKLHTYQTPCRRNTAQNLYISKRDIYQN